LDDNGDE